MFFEQFRVFYRSFIQSANNDSFRKFPMLVVCIVKSIQHQDYMSINFRNIAFKNIPNSYLKWVCFKIHFIITDEIFVEWCVLVIFILCSGNAQFVEIMEGLFPVQIQYFTGASFKHGVILPE